MSDDVRRARPSEAAAVLEDPAWVVSVVAAPAVGARSLAWLRAHVVRFSEGPAHARRRALVDAVLAQRVPTTLRRAGDPTATLAAALGLPRESARDVRTVAASYQPHVVQDPAADGTVDRLEAGGGGRYDEPTAAVICAVVQASAAVDAALAGRRPPVPATRRIGPAGELLEVPLDDLPFGAGRHACPGQAHADALVAGATAFARLHHGPEPLVLPNAWDVASAAALVRAGFAAVGTTSLGVAAALGVPDAGGHAADATLDLARRLAALPVPVTVDLESGLVHGDPHELGARLWEAGVAGVNVEDGRGAALADPAEQVAVVRALKSGAPGLFVNARTDTHWLGDRLGAADRSSTLDRLRAYADAGADGVFVPGLTDERALAEVVAAVPLPVNVLAQLPLPALRDLGVRLVSTGSLLARAALGAVVRTAEAVRDGAPGAEAAPDALAYDVADDLWRLVGPR
ncbi:hypothetical protein GCM10028777_40410 [Angustibacter speluncae]